MGAFDWPRALATLLLLALALACWRLLQSAPAQPLAPAAAAPKARKKPKKRAKKVAQSTSDAPLPVAPPAPPPTRAAAAAAAAAISEGDGSDDDSDADDGLSAAQVLARRKFHTTRALGASRAATSAATSSAKASPKFDVGQRVLARFQGGNEWFPATVTEVRRGNEYHLRYDDGEVEFRVSHKLMKPFEVAAPPAELGMGDGDGDDLPAADRVSSSSDGGGDGDESAAGDDDDEEEENEDDGWEIVGAASSKAKAAKLSAGATSSPAAGVGADGLTKRQRESRRKKERQREIKELARAQAQENGLHARWGGTYSKLKYVPPPPPHQT